MYYFFCFDFVSVLVNIKSYITYLIKKTVRTEEGEIENRLDDHGRKDQDTTHLTTARDMKNIKAHIANKRPHRMKN